MTFTKAPITFALAIAAALALAGCSTSTTSNAPAGSITDSAKATPSPTSSGSAGSSSGRPSFVNGVLTTPDVKIVITDHKVLQVGDPGNEYGDKPVIAFWYSITNVSGTDVNPDMGWISVIRAYQDNNPNAENELDMASLPDESFLDSQTETIKKGGTVQNAVAYEPDDLTTPVQLTASDDLWLSKIGTMTYELQQ